MPISHDVVKASDEVIGRQVLSADNKENLGKIEELAIRKENGQIEYAVLSFGGILGLGDKLFALPWRLLNFSPEENSFLININKDRLKNAPGFDKDHWPNMADQSFVKNISTYYGI